MDRRSLSHKYSSWSLEKGLPTHADVIARTLVDCGIEYVFGLPGGEITALVDACRRAGIRFILTGHETSAAMIAQVFGEMTGVPGACATTLGPGATNLVSGVANAFLDRAPLLAFTAEMPAREIRTKPHQRIDLAALFGPITKRSVSIGTVDTESLVRQSAALALRPRCGPVHLSLPSDIAVAEAGSWPPAAVIAEEPRRSATIDDIVARLRACVRPLMIVGLGAPPASAPGIRRLVEQLRVPFMVTGKAKGLLPEDHALFVGVASGLAIDRDIVETIRTADLVLGVGFDPVECDKTWFADIDVVAIDSARSDEGDYQPMQCIGNISELLTEVTARLRESFAWPEEILAGRRKAIVRSPRSGNGVSILALLDVLRRILPRNAIVTTDVGAHKFVAGQFFPSYEPGTFLMSNGLSSMGFGIPAAIGAQLARPDRHVVAIVGDGGMLMTAHDLALIRELKLPIVIICLVDRSLSLIRVSQQRRQYPNCGVDFVPPDFAAMAASFGIRGETLKSIEQARSEIEKALELRNPVLLQVAIDTREYDDLV